MERWLQEGQSNREIAKRFWKAPQTINREVKCGTVLQQVRKSKFEKHYSADYAQETYKIARKNSSRKAKIDKETKEKIVHYISPKYSPEMMVKSGKVTVPVSTIYYWIHHGHLGVGKEALLYPRKAKASKETD